jgi:hypothetical protein
MDNLMPSVLVGDLPPSLVGNLSSAIPPHSQSLQTPEQQFASALSDAIAQQQSENTIAQLQQAQAQTDQAIAELLHQTSSIGSVPPVTMSPTTIANMPPQQQISSTSPFGTSSSAPLLTTLPSQTPLQAAPLSATTTTTTTSLQPMPHHPDVVSAAMTIVVAQQQAEQHAVAVAQAQAQAQAAALHQQLQQQQQQQLQTQALEHLHQQQQLQQQQQHQMAAALAAAVAVNIEPPSTVYPQLVPQVPPPTQSKTQSQNQQQALLVDMVRFEHHPTGESTSTGVQQPMQQQLVPGPVSTSIVDAHLLQLQAQTNSGVASSSGTSTPATHIVNASQMLVSPPITPSDPSSLSLQPQVASQQPPAMTGAQHPLMSVGMTPSPLHQVFSADQTSSSMDTHLMSPFDAQLSGSSTPAELSLLPPDIKMDSASAQGSQSLPQQTLTPQDSLSDLTTSYHGATNTMLYQQAASITADMISLPSSSGPVSQPPPPTKRLKLDEEWTLNEDSLLRKTVIAHGHNWEIVSAFLQGRSPSDCAYRWRHYVGKKIHGRWSKEEDQSLLKVFQEYIETNGEIKKNVTTSWAKIAEKIPGRSGASCMVRYNESLDPTLR